MSFLIGQTVGDYLIVADVSAGGAGQVYKVEHTITRRREAMKVLAGEKSCPVEQADRFFREIRLQASLSHANIAAVHNAFWADDNLVLVCELLDGEPLHRVLERGRLSLSQALDVIIQVLAALNHAHAHGVMHGDVSPASIFLTRQGTVKLIDFGLAKAAADLQVTPQDVGIGSVHYMSPEQVRGEDTLDARSDLYACGVVLYEMVTGAKPFSRETDLEIMRAQTEEAPRLPHSVDSTLSKEIDNLIQMAMATKPEQRFQSADGFQKAVTRLRRCLGQRTGISHYLQPRRTLIGIGAVGLLLILAAYDSLRPTPRQEIPAQQARAISVTPVPPPPPPPAPTPKRMADVRAVQKKASQPVIPPTVANPSPHGENIGGTNPLSKFGRAVKRVNPFRRKNTPKIQPRE